jgi:hypothetical protein
MGVGAVRRAAREEIAEGGVVARNGPRQADGDLLLRPRCSASSSGIFGKGKMQVESQAHQYPIGGDSAAQVKQ